MAVTRYSLPKRSQHDKKKTNPPLLAPRLTRLFALPAIACDAMMKPGRSIFAKQKLKATTG